MSKYTKSPEAAACLFNVNDSQLDRGGQAHTRYTCTHLANQGHTHHVMHADAGRLRTRIKPKQIKNNRQHVAAQYTQATSELGERYLNKLRNIRAKPQNTNSWSLKFLTEANDYRKTAS